MSALDYGTSPASPQDSHLRRRRSPSPPPSEKSEGHASVGSSITNLTNTVIGAGALAFPSAFAALGLIPGIITCLISASLTSFGLYLLSRCATVVGTRPGDEGRKASFNEVAKLTFGKGWATRLFDFAIAIKCFGVSVSYLIICKTLLPQVSYTIAKAINHPLSPDSIMLAPEFWLLAIMLVIVPLSFLRTLDSLRFTSQIALSTVVYLIIVVVGWFFLKGRSPTRGEVVLGRFGRNTFSVFPVQVFAYTCAQNLFPIYNELQNKTQKRMNTVIIASIGSAAACYEVLGIVGYLTFGNKVGSNIIAMYPATSLFIAIGRLGIVLLVGLSYPLQLLPCRACLHTLSSGLVKNIQRRFMTREPRRVIQHDDNDEDDDEDGEGYQDPDATIGTIDTIDTMMAEDDPLMPRNINGEEGRRPKGEMTRRKFIFLTVMILALGFSIALVVDELEVVLGFVGSTGSTILSFILPGFFYFRLFRQEKGPTKWFALALGIYGIGVMCFCLTFNIINLERRRATPGH